MNRNIHSSGDDESAYLRTGSSGFSSALTSRNIASGLALTAIAGPALFTLAWLILGFVSPGFTLWDMKVAPYSPVSHPISGLGLGVTGPTMNAAFVVSGILIMAGAVGIFRSIEQLNTVARWVCTTLLAFTGLGMVVSGIFTLETIMPHTAGFLLGTGTPVVSFLVIGFLVGRIPSWESLGNRLLLGSPLTLALLVLALVTFDPIVAGNGLGVAGLTQRILVTEVLGWIAAMGWKAFRSSQPG